MPECGESGDAGGIDEVASVGEDVDVCSEGPNLEVKCKCIFLSRKGSFKHRETWRQTIACCLPFARQLDKEIQ